MCATNLAARGCARIRTVRILNDGARMAEQKLYKFPTKGLELIRKVPDSNSAIARRLDRGNGKPTPSTVSRWRSGDSRPEGINLELIEAAYGIPRDAWRLPEEKRERKARLKAIEKGAA